MESSRLLLEGVELMLYGMGFVFVFLLVLIGAIKVMSYLIGRHDTVAPIEPAISVPDRPVDIDGDTLAAIRAAIQQHRARRG